MSISEMPAQEKKPKEVQQPFKKESPAVERRILTPKELLEAEKVLLQKIGYYDRRIFKFGPEYTGFCGSIGDGTYTNTGLSSNQLIFAMLLSGHPLVMKLLEEDVTLKTFDPEPLRRAQILQGMKILDLGCGDKPAFVRVARRLGADAYTVDVTPANALESYGMSNDDKELELSRHIQLDLREACAAERIASLTGVDLDLVTEALLKSGLGSYRFSGGKALAMKLLKNGGFHFEPDWDNSKVTILEQPQFEMREDYELLRIADSMEQARRIAEKYEREGFFVRMIETFRAEFSTYEIWGGQRVFLP